MIPQRAFAVLTTALIVLTVTLGMVAAFQSLLVVLGDTSGAQLVRAISIVCLIALLVDALLLLVALGLRAMNQSDDSTREP